MSSGASKRIKLPRKLSSNGSITSAHTPHSISPKKRRKLKVVSSLAEHAGHRSLTEKLPDELVLEIYLHCVASLDTFFDFAGSDAHHDFTDRRNAPLNISQVSARWRRISLSSPKLWSAMVLQTDSLRRHHFDALNAWLDRSRSKKSSLVSISLLLRDAEQSEDTLLDLFRRLATHSERLKTLHAQLRCKIPSTVDMGVFNGPNLEEVVFTSTSAIGFPFKLLRSPGLKRLNLNGTMILSFGTLETLQCLEVDLLVMPPNLINLLGHFPSLESLSLKFRYWLGPEASIGSPIPKLRKLFVDAGLTPRASCSCFARLMESATELERLELSSITPYTPTSWRELTSIIERCKHPLRHLSIYIDKNNTSPEVDAPPIGFLASLLRHLPSLVSLSSNYGTNERFVLAMTLQSATDLNICPRLEEVQFDRFEDAVTAHALANMIVSRLNTGEKALRRVKLSQFYHHMIGRRRMIKMSVSRGLELSSTPSKSGSARPSGGLR